MEVFFVVDSVRTMLAVYKKKTIELSELEIMLPGLSYEQFAQTVLSLEEEGVIEMMKSKGRNTRNPALAYVYRLHTTPLKQALHADLIKHRLLLHPSIQLEVHSPKNNPKDFENANMAAKLTKDTDPPIIDLRRPPEGYTWHHHEDGKTMMLVDEDIHREFRHIGGQSKVNGKNK